jgi:PAS domain S-box-containing protein
VIDKALIEESADELFESAPCGYLTALPDGTLVRINDTFLALTGYARADLLNGKRFQELLTLPGRVYFDTHVGPLLHMQGFVRELAFDLLRADQSAVPVLLNAVLKRTEASPPLLKLTVFDATDRRRYERELLHARRLAEDATRIERLAREEAERASRAKDDILALVSHELKNPLGAILGWTQVLRHKSGQQPEIEQGLTVIERNTRLQVRLVDDLLDMSRIVSGKLRLDVQQVELAAVIEAALETAQPAALAKGIRIQSVLDSNTQVAGDPARLQQVFWNLLSNSVKFTPSGGSITVSMGRINSHVEVRVTDTGQGMASDLLAHVFERFRQANSEGTRRSGGLGLGLSLVKYLIEMHGGSVEARSAGEGQGSTFIVQLPLAVLEAAQSERVSPGAAVVSARSELPRVALHGTRVVIVDDEREVREVLWRMLTDCGAQVVAAASAREALEAIERMKPHVLVSDIGLEGEDGYELIQKVRMLGDTAGRVPAIALTALDRLEDRTRALLAGYQIHLAKPVDARELAITVASLAGQLPPSGARS